MIERIFSSLNGLGDLVDRIIKTRDAVKLGELKIELQGKVMSALQCATSAQTHELELTDTIRELKQQIVELENWEAEKKRYQMQKLPPGVLVYALKPEMADGEPLHEICERCYQDGTKSVLHRSGERHGVFGLSCQ